jgi:hypothetical protein
MSIVKTTRLYADKEKLRDLTNTLNELMPEQSVVLNSPENDISLKIQNNYSDALAFNLEQNYLEITRKIKGKFGGFYIDFQPKEQLPHDSNPRSGLHVLKKPKQSWGVEIFRPNRNGNSEYQSISLPIRNFGNKAMLYIYKSFQ